MSNNTTIPSPMLDPNAPVASPADVFGNVFAVFDSADSQETIIYFVISLLVLVGAGLVLQFIYWFAHTFKFPGWKIWSVTTRQRLAIYWTTSWLSLIVELALLLMALFSVTTFIYITIIIEEKTKQGISRSTILHIPWIYWIEFGGTLVNGVYVFFRLYTSRNGLYALLDAGIVAEMLAGIPLLTSPFRSQVAWNFQYMRVVRLQSAFSFLSRHPKTSFGGKRYEVSNYIFTSLCLLFGAGGFFFVLENKYFNQHGMIGDMIDSMYYVVITVSTCGYGDLTPKTILGRIGAIALALAAIIYLPIRIGKLVTIMQITTSGSVKNPGGHIIVSASSASDFETFVEEFFHPDRPYSDIILAMVAPTHEVELSLGPLVNRREYNTRLQALQGSLANPADYGNFYLSSAKAVFLLADKTKGSLGDASTLVTAMSLIQRYPTLPLYVQLQSQASKATAFARGISNTVCIQELRMGILTQNALHPGFAPFLLNLMRSSTVGDPAESPSNQWLNEYRDGEGNEFYSQAPLVDFIGLTFAEAALYLQRVYGITLVGIIIRTEKLVPKKHGKSSSEDTTGDLSSTKDTTTSTSGPDSSSKPLLSSDTSIPRQSFDYGGRGNASFDGRGHTSFDRTTRESFDAGGRVVRSSFDFNRNNRQSIDRSDNMMSSSGRGTSIDGGPLDSSAGDGSESSPLDTFDVVEQWELSLNPGPKYTITDGDQGLVLAQDAEEVAAIVCDDLNLLREITEEVATWKNIPKDHRDLHMLKLSAELAGTEDDGSLPTPPPSPVGERDIDPRQSNDSIHRTSFSKHRTSSDTSHKYVPLSSSKKSGEFARSPGQDDARNADAKIQSNIKDMVIDVKKSSGMVPLSSKSNVMVLAEMKENYELGIKPLELDDCIYTNIDDILEDHIIVTGDWNEDMYDVILPLRSRALKPHGLLLPIVFLGPTAPHPAMWDRINIFKDIYFIMGSQVDPKDLLKAGAVSARTILVLANSSGSMPDAKSLITLLILEKVTRAHVTIEVRSGDSLPLLLKGHAPLYREKPPVNHPDRPEYDAANNAYKEMSKLGISANPYFASGCVFAASFLDSLISVAYFNEQLVPVISAFTSPEAFQSVLLQDVWEAYPYLHERRIRVQKKRRRASKGSEDPKSAEMSVLPEYRTEYDPMKPVTCAEMFMHFLKYSNSLILAVRRAGTVNARPYIVTAPSPDMVLNEDDVCFILDADKIDSLCNYTEAEEELANIYGSIVDMPNVQHH